MRPRRRWAGDGGRTSDPAFFALVIEFFFKPNSFITNGQGATPIGRNSLTDMVVEFFMEKTHTGLHQNNSDSNPPVYNFTVRVASAGCWVLAGVVSVCEL